MFWLLGNWAIGNYLGFGYWNFEFESQKGVPHAEKKNCSQLSSTSRRSAGHLEIG
jgi:hypothetical protein